MDCDPIGVVRTPFETTGDAPRQGLLGEAEGRVELDPAYEAGLAGWDGDRVLVVWVAHRADRSVLSVGRPSHPDEPGSRGVFATRSPARPNPVCLTECDVVAVEGATLHVRGVDMLDGSPVLDLKPPLREPDE